LAVGDKLKEDIYTESALTMLEDNQWIDFDGIQLVPAGRTEAR
jgi:hypothetical protein